MRVYKQSRKFRFRKRPRCSVLLLYARYIRPFSLLSTAAQTYLRHLAMGIEMALKFNGNSNAGGPGGVAGNAGGTATAGGPMRGAPTAGGPAAGYGGGAGGRPADHRPAGGFEDGSGAGGGGRSKHHVHNLQLVRGRPFYGYTPAERLYIKIVL